MVSDSRFTVADNDVSSFFQCVTCVLMHWGGCDQKRVKFWLQLIQAFAKIQNPSSTHDRMSTATRDEALQCMTSAGWEVFGVTPLRLLTVSCMLLQHFVMMVAVSLAEGNAPSSPTTILIIGHTQPSSLALYVQGKEVFVPVSNQSTVIGAEPSALQTMS